MGVLLCELSGGFDSAAATVLALREGHTVHALCALHGQEYDKQELAGATYVAAFLRDKYGERFKKLHVAAVSLMQELPDAKTPRAYVPIRNLVLGALSANHAQALGAEAVVVGSKTTVMRPDDPYCFFDCSTAFYEQLGQLVTAASQPGQSMRFVQALVRDGVPMSKADVVRLLLDEGLNLRGFWNCYGAGLKPCRTCAHCIEMANVVREVGCHHDYADWW
jgi:7-cyano-7-deazaguanine synthase in queuosine biosynthesis